MINEILFLSGLIAVLVGFIWVVRSAFFFNPVIGVVILFFPFLIPVYCVVKYKHAGAGLVIFIVGVVALFGVNLKELKENNYDGLYKANQLLGGLIDIENLPKKSQFIPEKPDLTLVSGKITGVFGLSNPSKNTVTSKSFTSARAIIRQNKLVLVSDLVEGHVVPDGEIVIQLPEDFTNLISDKNENFLSEAQADFHLVFRISDDRAVPIRIQLYNRDTGDRDVIILNGGYELDLQLNKNNSNQFFGNLSLFIPSDPASYVKGEFMAEYIETGLKSNPSDIDIKGQIEFESDLLLKKLFSRYIKKIVGFEDTRWYAQNGVSLGKTTVSLDLKDSRRLKMEINFYFKSGKWKADSNSLIAINDQIKPKESVSVLAEKNDIGPKVTNFKKAIGKRVIIVSVDGIRRAGRLIKYNPVQATIAVPVGDEEAEFHLGLGSIKGIYYPKT